MAPGVPSTNRLSLLSCRACPTGSTTGQLKAFLPRREYRHPSNTDARVAAEQMIAEHRQQRQLIVDRLDACREAEIRASREYKLTDNTYTTVRRRLAEKWDRCLQVVAVEERRLAEFDAQAPCVPTAQQLEQLQQLSRNLEAVWFDPTTDWVLKKQIARTLIEEIIVDIEPSGNEIVLNVHWCGGHHTETRVARPTRLRKTHATHARYVIETLRKVLSDQSIANVLNREAVPTWNGKTWTKLRVEYFRRRYDIPAFDPEKKAENG